MNKLHSSLFALFPMYFSMVPEGGGEAPKPEGKPDEKRLVKIPENAAQIGWHEIGKREGKRVAEIEGKAEMLASEVLLTYGEFLAGEEASVNDWLNGYVSAFPVNSQKVRKSEAKAVFDAFSIGEQKRTLVVGLVKDPATGKEEPQKIEREISDWLQLHEETGYKGYGGLIKLARTLRGAVSTGQGAGGGRQREVKLTDKQHSEFIERLPAASANQAMEVIEKANARLMSGQHWQLTMFREMNMLLNRIKVGTKADEPNAKIYLDAVGQMIDVVESVLAKAQSIVTPTLNKPAAPAPAQANAPQSENVQQQKAA